MSAFYDQASLVVVPSGYKSGKIYAQKPLTTDGQLTFTRASTATRVNASGLIETVSSGVPRLDYLGSSCPKILLEPQRTNISAFEEAGTGNYTTATVTSGTSILGLTTFRVASNYSLGDAPHIINASNYQSGTTYTASSYVNLAATDGTEFQLSMFGFGSPNGSASATMNISTKAVSVEATAGAWTGATGKATLISGNIYRLELTATAAQTLAGSRLYCAVPANNKYIEVAGIQVEAGAYATSFINKPSTAAVTRLADAASKTGISSLIGQTEGTIFYEFVFKTGAGITDGQFGISTSAGNDRVIVWNNFSLTGLGLQLKANSINVVNNVSLGTFVDGTSYKMAVAYKSGSIAVYVNGVSVYTSSASFTFANSLTEFYVGTYELTGMQPHQKVNQALLFTSRLTNAQLAELTTL